MFALNSLLEMNEEGFDLKGSLLEALFFASFMTLYFKLFARIWVPVNFKEEHYDKVLMELEKKGAVLLKDKKDIKHNKIPDRPWWNNRIRVKKTAFYSCLEVPENVEKDYVALVEKLGTDA
jgi:hypothetical protein